ncbi:hypothetical protein [Rhizobium bangladeshense]|nr:hypothetical protein [Rhizobium bangladeshense]
MTTILVTGATGESARPYASVLPLAALGLCLRLVTKRDLKH